MITSLVTLLAVFFTFWLSAQVGKMRHKHSIKAPAISGNEEFELTFRTHQNTIEQMVMFLPCLWLANGAVGDQIAGGVGVVWLLGRIVYAKTYMSGADRSKGMWVTFLSLAALFLMALWGVAGDLIGSMS